MYMELYNEIISHTKDLLGKYEYQRYEFDKKGCFQENDSSELVLLRDAAYELGGSGTSSVNFTCVTTSENLIKEDQIYCLGPDLSQITKDVSFARIVFLSIHDIGGDEEAYKAIRNMEYIKYHVFPKGYMVRISAESHQEQVRVSRQSLKEGLSFACLGNTYIQKYKENPNVKHVHILFITDSELVRKLIPEAVRVDDITRTLTHILEGIPISCNTCNLKSVCDEVEGLREMHLGRRAKLVK